MARDAAEGEHTPGFTEVPPADSIGRYLCEVTCSCGLFRSVATSGRDAATARAEAIGSFDHHRERASTRARPAQQRHAASEDPPAPPPTRRGAAPVVAAVAVAAVLAVAVGLVQLGGRQEGRDYRGAPALVGGPDRTGPAVLGSSRAAPSEPAVTAASPTTRVDGYDALRAEAPEFVPWSDVRIEAAGTQVCALVRAGRTAGQILAGLTADGVDIGARDVEALITFARTLDC